MAAASFTRRLGGGSGGAARVPAGCKAGRNGALLVSTGLSDLDKAIGGGIPLGGLLLVVEDLEAPHHLLLLRYFMAQALSHGQPLLFASSLPSPNAFLGTLPAPAPTSQADGEQEAPRLRIAWQYRKYDEQGAADKEGTEYSSSFDLRRPFDPAAVAKGVVECLSMQSGTPSYLAERSAHFVSSLCCSPRLVGRIALHSLAAPQCAPGQCWDLLALLLHLKSLLTTANAVAMITIPASLLPARRRWEHLADVLLSVKALPDEDRGVLDHQEASALLQVDKLPSLNTQVPCIPQAAAYAVKVRRKKELVLEPLHLAPIDAKLSSACNASD